MTQMTSFWQQHLLSSSITGLQSLPNTSLARAEVVKQGQSPPLQTPWHYIPLFPGGAGVVGHGGTIPARLMSACSDGSAKGCSKTGALKLDDIKHHPKVWNTLQMQINLVMLGKHNISWEGREIFPCQIGRFCGFLMKVLFFVMTKQKAQSGAS